MADEEIYLLVTTWRMILWSYLSYWQWVYFI